MLFAYMNREQFEQILVCSADFHKEDYEALVDYFEQVDMCNALSPKKDSKAVKSVRQLMMKYKPNLIYCHSSKGGGIGRLAAYGLGIPVIYNPHGWAFSMKGSRLKSLIYQGIERFLAHLTNQFVVISNYEKLLAVERHVGRPEKMKVIFNGIDFKAVDRQLALSSVSRASLGIPEDAYVVGMVGRISAQKAPDIFVKAASSIKKQIPNAWFVIVGDGDEKQEIEQMAHEYDIRNVLTITGWVDNPLAYANLFDQAVLLSRWEGFGLVLAEFMKLGKPIVATAVDAIPDLITDYENGLLVEVDNPEMVASAVHNIYNDCSLKDALIKNGLMRVNALFNVNRVAKEHERLFEKLTLKYKKK
jgi:glycosyltransferase involved in cell wall biosynthesis